VLQHSTVQQHASAWHPVAHRCRVLNLNSETLLVAHSASVRKTCTFPSLVRQADLWCTRAPLLIESARCSMAALLVSLCGVCVVFNANDV